MTDADASNPTARQRYLLLTAVCATDRDRAAESWTQFIVDCGGENRALDWLSIGPARRVMPFLGSRAEILGLGDRIATACWEATAEAWALNRKVVADAASVIGHLHDHDIQVMALKGLALVGEVYSPHWTRAIGDIDLLIRPSEYRHAVKVLEANGWHIHPRVPRPRRGQAAIALARSEMTSVDVHSRPSRNLPHRWPGLPSCWQGAQPVGANHPLAGLPLLRPTPEHHLVIVAAHLARATNHDLLHPVLDFCQLLLSTAESHGASIDTDLLLAAADAEGARGRVARALELATGFGIPGPETLPVASRTDRRREEFVNRADLRIRARERGIFARVVRTVSSARACSAGQGPIATSQVAIFEAGRLARYARGAIRRRLHLVTRSPSRTTTPVDSGGELHPSRHFGVADDGAIIEVRSTHPDIDTRLRDLWPPIGLRLTTEPPSETSLSVVEIIGPLSTPEVRVDGSMLPGGWDAVESALGLFAAERLADLIAVHAAVLVWDGKAVLVPGVSYAGKSTLAVACHAAGAIVASDEFALVDPSTGTVRGWKRRVRVRTPSGLTRADIAVEIEPTPVAVVAAIAFTEGQPELRELSNAETVMELLANTVCARSRPREAMAAASAVARSARGIGGRRGEANETVHTLRALCQEWPTTALD